MSKSKKYQNQTNEMVVVHNGNSRKKAFVMMYRFTGLPNYTTLNAKELTGTYDMRLSEVKSLIEKNNFKEVELL